jgi:predicted NBD/HSP70 family sugar kinase
LVGDIPVRRALSEAGRHLGMVLANVVALLDIGHVVLAPDLLNAGDILIEEIRTELASRILPTTADLVEIEATQLGGDLVLAGAASGVLVDHLGVVLR